MNIQRFTAPTSREAMNKARKTFGDSAVILSTRNTGDGFEVMAAAEESLASLAEHAAAPVVAAAERAPQRLEAAPARASKPAVSLAAAQSVQSDTETLAMSTLSFQDYVRERMLRKRREALHGTPAASVSAPAAEPAAEPRRAPLQAAAPQFMPQPEPVAVPVQLTVSP